MEDKTTKNIQKQAKHHIDQVQIVIDDLDKKCSDYILEDGEVRMTEIDEMFKQLKYNLKKLKELRKYT